MSVTSYEQNGKRLWKVYVNVRSKENPAIRKQRKAKGFESEKAALSEEKKLLRKLTESIGVQASQGFSWEAVIDRWQDTMKSERAYYADDCGSCQLLRPVDIGVAQVTRCNYHKSKGSRCSGENGTRWEITKLHQKHQAHRQRCLHLGYARRTDPWRSWEKW